MTQYGYIMHWILGAVVCLGFLVLGAFPAHAAMTQNDYRFYANTDALVPTDPWPVGGTDLGENTAITTTDAVASGDVVRIRMSVNVTSSNESGYSFKLQYKEGVTCSGGGTWTDVGAAASGEIWRGYNNATPSDGTDLDGTTLQLAVSDVPQTYEEENNSATMPAAIDVGQDGEWDWVLENNSAPTGKTYCFRMVKSDNTVLDGYDDYPTLVTETPVYETRNWQWFDDEDQETPSEAFAAETIRAFGVKESDPLKLRITVAETVGIQGVDQKFSLEYSTTSDFSSDVHAVTEIGSCSGSSLWCYADGSDDDDDLVSTRVLTDSTTAGTHNESGTSGSTFDHVASGVVEYEFTLMSEGGVVSDEEYYFRLVDVASASAVSLGSGEAYPQVKTFALTLSLTVSGVSASTELDGHTTTQTSTATSLGFDPIVPNEEQISAHQLTATSDGYGYTIYVVQTQTFQNITGDVIHNVEGTNSSPVAWSFKQTVFQTSAFGYHPSDNELFNGSTRFSENDTWAALETTSREIAYHPVPVENNTHHIVYRLVAGALQPEGVYETDIQYQIIPTF